MPDARRKVAVLMGGSSAEREISLMSGTMVLAALKRRGVEAHALDPAHQPLDELRTGGFTHAFVALHGRFGEDGTVQGALEMLRIPYTGAGVCPSAIAIDKAMTKRVWEAEGLATPAWRLLRLRDGLEPEGHAAAIAAAADAVGLPLVVKPASEGSTLGLTKVEHADRLGDAVALAARYDRAVLLERMVRGRELTVAILGEGTAARALPVIEIRAPQGNYDYQNKYFTDSTEYLCPAPLDAGLTARVQALALAAYRALECQGWGRCDLMLDDAGEPWLLEMNTAPGMTDHSLVPMAARADGMDYDTLVLTLLDSAALKVRAPEVAR